ncbi:hypothetical protein ACL03H_06465 [Saccharopolyspora sp. MS10]|uniref:hypothetical protein n=1 Tax=Saccharopolyspora sp. MS10 TaxID=3385973 RepID=UPI0039A04FE3
MRIVLAAESEGVASELGDLFSEIDGVLVRSGAVGEVAADCDAILMKFYLAHDRYGGSPVVGESQVLTNSRGDGLPGRVVATSPFPSSDTSTDDSEVERRLRSMFARAFDAVRTAEGIGEDWRVLVHREGLGLDAFSAQQIFDAIRASR